MKKPTTTSQSELAGLRFLVLRGRCRVCRQPIPLQCIAVECFCALLAVATGASWTASSATSEHALDFFALASHVMGASDWLIWSYPVAAHPQWAQFCIILIVTFGLVLVALIDACHYRIPGPLVLSLLLIWAGVTCRFLA